ncbi:hypothetical protein [Klebsiella aerogenes]|uniref:hypothetical protein n=1 Tax=Klebsiella aerogenes TaxID=548 RepID=UPI0018C8C8B1|nr:hypothetical protein [Klebsiella aerogenes]
MSANASSGLRLGIRPVAPVSVSATGEESRMSANASSGLRLGIRSVAPVSVSATGELLAIASSRA